jgi:hypothetical protein
MDGREGQEVVAMPDDSAPKSAYELAMERLRKKDEAAGVTSARVTDEQKAAIAEVRNYYEAKLAEQQVLHQSAVRKVTTLEQKEALEQEYRRDRERFTSERDRKIEKIRKG